MFIEVTRSEAITALLQGICVFCGPSPDYATGLEFGRPQGLSRRKAAKRLTRFFYGDSFFPRYMKARYWV